MKNIIIIGDNDYARVRAHMPDYSVVLHDYSRGLPHDLYAAHIRLAETSEDFEVIYTQKPEGVSYFEQTVIDMAHYFKRKVIIVI